MGGTRLLSLKVSHRGSRPPVSDRKKKFGERATRLKRALANEQKKYRHIEDGAGKRYLIGPF